MFSSEEIPINEWVRQSCDKFLGWAKVFPTSKRYCSLWVNPPVNPKIGEKILLRHANWVPSFFSPPSVLARRMDGMDGWSLDKQLEDGWMDGHWMNNLWVDGWSWGEWFLIFLGLPKTKHDNKTQLWSSYCAHWMICCVVYWLHRCLLVRLMYIIHSFIRQWPNTVFLL